MQWDADHRFRIELADLIEPLTKSRVLAHILNQNTLPVLSDPPRDSLPEFHAAALQNFGTFSHRNLEAKMAPLRIHEQQRPVSRLEQLPHFCHYIF